MMNFFVAAACLAVMLGSYSVNAQGEMVKMCLFYDTPSGHARSDPIINQQCASGHVHTVGFALYLTLMPSVFARTYI